MSYRLKYSDREVVVAKNLIISEQIEVGSNILVKDGKGGSFEATLLEIIGKYLFIS